MSRFASLDIVSGSGKEKRLSWDDAEKQYGQVPFLQKANKDRQLQLL